MPFKLYSMKNNEFVNTSSNIHHDKAHYYSISADYHFIVWVTDYLIIWWCLDKVIWKLALIFQYRERASPARSKAALQMRRTARRIDTPELTIFS